MPRQLVYQPMWMVLSSVSYFINHNNRGMTTQQVSLNGSALANRNLNYSVQQSKASEGQADSTSLALQRLLWLMK